MNFDLDDEDQELVKFLVTNCDLLEPEAWVFTLITTKQIARTVEIPRLVEILKLYHYYDLFLGEAELRMAIKGLIDKGFLSLTNSDRDTYVSCSNPIQAVNTACHCTGSSDLLNRAVSILSHKLEGLEKGPIQILGPATSKSVGTTFMKALETACSEIKLPVFSTRSHGPLRDALDRAVLRGVHIKLLMYSPSAARRTYGGDYDKEIKMMADHWRREMREMNRQGPGRIDVRMIRRLDHLHFAGGLLIDRSLYRYGLRYPQLQRGHEAVVVTGSSFDDECSNLFMLLDYYFDIAWSAAIPIDPIGRLVHLVTLGRLPR